MNFLFLGTLIVLCVLGALEIIRVICFKVTKPPENSFTLLVQIRNKEECEFIIDSLLERIRWNDIDFRVILLYNRDMHEIKEIAEKLIEKYNNISLSTYEDLNYNLIIN